MLGSYGLYGYLKNIYVSLINKYILNSISGEVYCLCLYYQCHTRDMSNHKRHGEITILGINE